MQKCWLCWAVLLPRGYVTLGQEVTSPARAMQDAGKVKGGPSLAFAAAAAQLQLHLLEAYLALLEASASTMEHAEA